ncbi:2-dehydro-3-deoxygalactonokinase [Mucilaginibacter calamicampi]|uniref:2-dehydro-3-deoxygalactonokinase n=1 Tax=Mucilaginibacter calamicampi TaxID=1302352 RepID=A0ABW2YU89_9SPHI
MEKHIISCDWGSTSFRLRLVDRTNQAVLSEVLTDEGIIFTFNAYQANAAHSNLSRKQYFLEQLKTNLSVLSNKSSVDLSGLDIVISGMASASIGMHELPYADLPFATDGSQARVQIFEAEESFQNRIILISGVKSDSDVMRGEEAQLIGLVQLLGINTPTETVFILPGTHSKHLSVRADKLVDIQTFMTGELYNILTHHSILKDSVDVNVPEELSAEDKEAFVRGVHNSASVNILNSLFSVRTNQLFNKLGKKQNALYLSGLLMGNELAGLQKHEDVPLILCTGGAVHKLYRLAFECLGLLTRTTIVPADVLSRATIAGQIIIAQNNTPLYEN